MSYITPLMIEQHIHGAFGIDFNTASVDDVLNVAEKLPEFGIGGFFPTLVTDSVENIKKQILIIKEANASQKSGAKILGIHLEGIFINPKKKGIHNEEHFLDLSIDNYNKLEDNFIKIITLAPELDNGLINYLKTKDVKIQAGHCVGSVNNKINAVTHLFNAMEGINHRNNSTTLSALLNDSVYTEIIADGVHLSDEILGLVFSMKPIDKILLISDALPITYSELKETNFADSKIYYDGVKATSANGTIAGSTTLLNKIVKKLASIDLFDKKLILNPYNYHKISPFGEIIWDENWNIESISLR